MTITGSSTAESIAESLRVLADDIQSGKVALKGAVIYRGKPNERCMASVDF